MNFKVQNSNNIGLVVWGFKRGQSTFFRTPFIDETNEDIRCTLIDVRGVIRFTNPKIDFFGLSFTSEYKVYTQYRTIYDWVNRDGCYIAITIYIPYNYEIEQGEYNVHSLLTDLMNLYWKEYVGTDYKIKDERENPEIFFELLSKVTLIFKPLRYNPSPSNNNYAVIRYKNDSELRLYFDDPYRSEYIDFQEVLFVSSDFDQSFPSLTELTVLPIDDKEYTIIVLDKNGKTLKSFPSKKKNDEVKIRVEIPYHEPYEDVLLVKSLISQAKDQIILFKPVFEPSTRKFSISIKDNRTGRLINDDFLVEIVDNMEERKQEIIATGGVGICEFKGDELGDTYSIYISSPPLNTTTFLIKTLPHS